MAEDLVVEREESATVGRYVIKLDGGYEAEMTFRKAEPATIIIDHTHVPHNYRGGGIALKLVEAAVADARAEGKKILPLCSYVVAQFRRHPEWSDLRASA